MKLSLNCKHVTPSLWLRSVTRRCPVSRLQTCQSNNVSYTFYHRVCFQINWYHFYGYLVVCLSYVNYLCFPILLEVTDISRLKNFGKNYCLTKEVFILLYGVGYLECTIV